MPVVVTESKHQQRLALYNQGLGDQQIGDALGGLNESTIRQWRKRWGLKPNYDVQVSVPMEAALTESQCQQMRRFMGCLTTYADRFPQEKIDVLVFAKEYKEGVGEFEQREALR